MVMRVIYIPRTADTKGVASARSDTASQTVADDERRADPRYSCNYNARIASSDRAISTAGRIVNISTTGAKVEVMYSKRGPSTIFLLDQVNDEVYECEVRWRTAEHIGVRFLDVLGPSRRRKFFAGDSVPIKTSAHQIIQLEQAPTEDVRAGPPPRRMGANAPPTQTFIPSAPTFPMKR